MRQFAKRYFGSLAALLLIFSMYGLVVVPLVEPEGREAPPLPEYEGPFLGDQWWHGFFGAGAWQTDSPRLLRSERGILLAKSWDQVGPRTLELKPLTIIVPRTETGGAHSDPASPSSVWIVSAEQGAVIKFEKPFDAHSGKVPAVESGKLNGMINITRKSIGGGDEVPWSLTSSELFIERGRVYTDESVAIRWGNSAIVGRDLKVQLKGDLFGGNSKTDSPWGPLDTMQLYKIDQVDIELPPGGIWAGIDLPEDTPINQHPPQPAKIQALCGGRFSFDFNRSMATLTNGVQIVQQLGTIFRDEFSCQQLQVEIDAPDSGSDKVADGNLQYMQISMFEAIGMDKLETFVGEKRVDVRAPSIGAYASAKRIKVDVDSQVLEFAGKLPSPGAAVSMAWLQFSDYKLSAPRIEYDADGEAIDSSIEHLGYLAASGPGEIVVAGDSELGSARVSWSEKLVMLPTDGFEQQRIGIFGDALVNSQSHGTLSSDRLDIWLRKAAQVDARTPGSPETARYLPDHLQASGNVEIKTEQLLASVDQVLVDVVIAQGADNPIPATSPLRPELRDSVGNEMFQWVSPPNQTNNSGQLATAGASRAPVEPVIVNGKSLTSRIVVNGKQSWIDDLQIVGPLRIYKETTEANPVPWHVEGDHLSLLTNAAGQVNMNVSGQPARIVFADGFLAGPSIGLDQQINLIWMDHPGTFTVPSQSTSKGRPEGSIEWIEHPVCQWEGGMYFDGNSVHLKDGVKFKATFRVKKERIWLVNGDADELKVYLNRSVDLNKPQQEKAEIERLELNSNVNILARQIDNRGDEKSREQIVVPKLTFHPLQEQIIGTGPGMIRSWHYIKGKGPGQMASSLAATGTQQLHGAHLTFRDAMVAFLQQNRVVIEGKVEVGAGPLASLEQQIDLYSMQRLLPGQTLIACEQLQAYDTSPLSSTAKLTAAGSNGSWNLEARGNVSFQGVTDSHNYFGKGNELKYIQAKNQLRLAGDAYRDAHIRSAPTHGTGRPFDGFVTWVEINTLTGVPEDFTIGKGGLRVGDELPAGSAAPQPGAQPAGSPLGPIPQGQAPIPSIQPRGAAQGMFQPRQD